jgi:hypothetical protein
MTTPVKITASYPGSRSAVAKVTIQIEVVKPPAPHVPQLQFITIEATDGSGEQIPSNRTLVLGRKLQLRAAGVYDGSTADLTAQVTWSSTPESVATVSKIGLVTTVGVGKCTVKASQGRIANEIDLEVDEDRAIPPRPGPVSARDQGQPERIDRSSRRRGPQLPCHRFYANGKTTDWSKAVLWSAAGNAFEIDKNGVARMKALGKGSISVALKEPVKALHAAEGVYKGRSARIECTCSAPPSKAPVKLPDRAS